MRQRRFGQRHDAAVGQEQQEHDQRHRGVAARQQQAGGEQQGQRGGQAQQLLRRAPCPLWSPVQLQAYGATTRVHDCNDAMAPMATVEKPSDWNHSGAYGLSSPIDAK